MANVLPNGRPENRRLEFERELVEALPHLVAFARSLVGSVHYAEDLAQETMAKALKAWEKFEPGSSMKAWTFMILRNHLYSEKRRSWRTAPLDQELAETIVDRSFDPAMHEEVIQELCALAPILASLSPHHRDMIIGVRYLGLSYEAMSSILDCATGTIKSGVSRAAIEINHALKVGTKYKFDIEAWATATKKVPKNHAYYPIAQAYEEIYKLVAENSTKKSENILHVESLPENPVDLLWKQMQDSGVLDEEASLESLTR